MVNLCQPLSTKQTKYRDSLSTWEWAPVFILSTFGYTPNNSHFIIESSCSFWMHVIIVQTSYSSVLRHERVCNNIRLSLVCWLKCTSFVYLEVCVLAFFTLHLMRNDEWSSLVAASISTLSNEGPTSMRTSEAPWAWWTELPSKNTIGNCNEVAVWIQVKLTASSVSLWKLFLNREIDYKI